MLIDPFLSPYTKLKCRRMKYIHIKSDMLNLIGEKVGKSLANLNTGQNSRTEYPYLMFKINYQQMEAHKAARLL